MEAADVAQCRAAIASAAANGLDGSRQSLDDPHGVMGLRAPWCDDALHPRRLLTSAWCIDRARTGSLSSRIRLCGSIEWRDPRALLLSTV